MRKIHTFIATATMAAALLPTMAFAHSGKSKNEQNTFPIRMTVNGDVNLRDELKQKMEDMREDQKKQRKELEEKMKDLRIHHRKMGTVSAVGTTSFDLKLSDGTTLTVLTASAKITKVFGGEIKLADIKVSDEATVFGTISGNQLTASHVMITPANTHPAKAKGTVTAVNGNTITVQTMNSGVPSTVTVNTDSNTTVTKSDGSTGTTADVKVGAMVKIKGLWDEIKNVFNAFKIKIK